MEWSLKKQSMLSCVLENKIGFHTKKFAVKESYPQERRLMPSLF